MFAVLLKIFVKGLHLDLTLFVIHDLKNFSLAHFNRTCQTIQSTKKLLQNQSNIFTLKLFAWFVVHQHHEGLKHPLASTAILLIKTKLNI